MFWKEELPQHWKGKKSQDRLTCFIYLLPWCVLWMCQHGYGACHITREWPFSWKLKVSTTCHLRPLFVDGCQRGVPLLQFSCRVGRPFKQKKTKKIQVWCWFWLSFWKVFLVVGDVAGWQSLTIARSPSPQTRCQIRDPLTDLTPAVCPLPVPVPATAINTPLSLTPHHPPFPVVAVRGPPVLATATSVSCTALWALPPPRWSPRRACLTTLLLRPPPAANQTRSQHQCNQSKYSHFFSVL